MTINPKPNFSFFLYFFCTIFTLENFPKKFFNKLFSISLHFSEILFETMTDVPENAPESCPGTQSEKAGKTSACAGCPNQKACSTGVPQIDPDIDLIKERMAFVRHKVREQGYYGFNRCFLFTNGEGRVMGKLKKLGHFWTGKQ
ncbi:unnamed protein product [Meloidogyne enterolobii]|uniref:Uncharacterized protein n=1 Tax=Meloidogyne enterolobii TaxID=390850 RepID=A0ACB0YM00_MELEN